MLIIIIISILALKKQQLLFSTIQNKLNEYFYQSIAFHKYLYFQFSTEYEHFCYYYLFLLTSNLSLTGALWSLDKHTVISTSVCTTHIARLTIKLP